MTACVCGHLTHFGECGEPITRTAPTGLIRGFCHCSVWEPPAKCVCGHRETGHYGYADGICDGDNTSCTCSQYTPDDGTDGPSTAPGPHHASDPYKGKYGTNQRYPRGEAS